MIVFSFISLERLWVRLHRYIEYQNIKDADGAKIKLQINKSYRKIQFIRFIHSSFDA